MKVLNPFRMLLAMHWRLSPAFCNGYLKAGHSLPEQSMRLT